METTDKTFSGAIPELYDQYMVPMIFQEFAEDLAARVAARSPMSVMETAAGTGVLTRALAPLLSSEARYVVTDLNPPMLAQAQDRQLPDERLSWQPVDALSLPFDDGMFDAVCCQFGVMFFPDRVAGYKEARRVLRPGGLYAFNTWDRIEDNEFAHIVEQTLADVFPDDPPVFMSRTPHGYFDTERIRRDVEAAGFSDVEIATIETGSPAPSAMHAAIAYCQGTPFRNEIAARNAELLRVVTDKVAASIAERFGDGPISGRIRGHVVTAVA